MPFLLLAAVYVPLRKALDEVAWQIRVRSTVQQVLSRLPQRIVHSKVFVERGTVEIALVVLGTASDAIQSKGFLLDELKRVTDAPPRLDVFAVPDAAGVEEALLRNSKPVSVPAKPAVNIADAQIALQDAVTRVWPMKAAGAPLAISLSAEPDSALRIVVFHLGEPLDKAAREIVEKSVTASLGTASTLDDRALPPTLTPTGPTDTAFALRVAGVVHDVKRVGDLRICLTLPDESAPKDAKEERKKVDPKVEFSTTQLKALARSSDRITTLQGESLQAVIVEGQCPVEEAKR
jgi:hypothetical protein